MWTTTRVRRRGILGALALAAWLGPARAHAADLGDTPVLPKVDPAKGAEENFELNALGIIREGDGAHADWRISRGKYREHVSRHDFFVMVGRPDLEERDSSRNAKHNLMVLGGIVALVAGVFVAGASFTKGGWDPPWELGVGLMAGGAIAYFASDVFEGPDLKADEAEGLIRRYNERLRERMQEPTDRDNHIQALRSLHLGGWIGSGSGGLAVAARF